MFNRPIDGRAERVDLNGEWRLTFDEAALWRDAAPHPPGTPVAAIAPSPPTADWSALERGMAVRVPGTAEAIRPGYHGVTWWSREVALPGDAGVRLRFGGARLLAEVYWDRRLVGYDLEGSTPFAVTIPTDLAGPGTHRLDVRITNPGGSDNWEDLFPLAWAGRILPSSHDFGGLWQPVVLELDRGTHIVDVYVRPNPALDAALVDVRCASRAAGALSLRLEDPDGRTVAEARHAVAPGPDRVASRLVVPSPMLYAPGSPNRYRLVIALDAGATDAREERFGFRLLDAPGSGLRYNGEPFYLRTAISWGWYADGPVPNPDEIAAEVASIDAFGLNAITAHRAVSTPALQDALEAKGLLLYQEPGGGASLRPRISGSAWLQEPDLGFALALMALRVRRLARRDRNRACLVWWNLANEVFDVDAGEPGEPARRLIAALREEDDSRLTTWTSAWGPTPMLRPFRTAAGRSFDFHTVLNWPSTWNRQLEREVAALAPPEPMPFLSGESSTMGGLGGLHDLAERYPADLPAGSAGQAVRDWVRRLEEDLAAVDPGAALGGARAFCAATAAVQGYGVTRLAEATRANPHADGLAINGWHSHPNIGTMGITRLDRRPGFDPEILRRANAPIAAAVLGLEPQVAVGDRHPDARLVLLDDAGRAGGRVTVSATLRAGDDVLWAEEWTRAPERGAAERIWDLGPLPLPVPRAGLLRVEVGVRMGGTQVRTDVEYLGVGTPTTADRPFALHDPLAELAPWFGDRGITTEPWTLDRPGPVLVAGSGLRSLHTPFYGPPRRSAFLLRGGPHFRSRVFLSDLQQLGFASAPPTEVPIRGDWLGGWAFSLGSSALPALGPADVWGWPFGPTFPEFALRGLAGEVLAGACSFPEGSVFGVGLPAVGATAIILRRGGHELLLTTLPLVERLGRSPLAGVLLLELARWLVEPRGAG